MEIKKRWDYRSLSFLLAGCLGLVVDISAPGMKQVFCGNRVGYVAPVPLEEMEHGER